ncbi:MAG: hypothetical protein FJ008_07950 [Chloroflexi bacterium]|nr:hypothetical protein [Chloroflexota bacterium]MBM3175562.1 hypothetical protein [Chloroflexota bacterium]
MLKHGIRILCGLFCLLGVLFAGCNQTSYQSAVASSNTSAPIALAATHVPNVDIDLYIWAQQEKPTIIPSSLLRTEADILIDSIAVWGMVVGGELVVGTGVKAASADDARLLDSLVSMDANGWKMLSGDVLYLVSGSATAREPLKNAISRLDFKYFDDVELLRAASRLPNNTTDRPIAIGVIKPTVELVNYLARGATDEQTRQMNTVIELVDPRAIAIGVYSKKPLDVAQVLGVMQGKIDVSKLDICALGVMQSGRPSLLVESTAKTLLKRSGFDEIAFGTHVLYRMWINTNQQQARPLLVWLNGNRVFASAAIQEAHAQQMISAAIAANLQD